MRAASAERKEHLAELARLAEALKVVQKRCSLNLFLRELVRPVCAVLLLLLAGAAISPRLGWAPAAAVALVAGALGWVRWRVRSRRLSPYEAAVQLDRAAALKDRLSTAYYFSEVREPAGLLRLQREDALERLAKLDIPTLFPMAVPDGARRAAALLLVVAALFAYRLRYDAPLTAVVLKAAQTPIIKAMISPIAHAMERSQQSAKAQAGVEPGRGDSRAGGDDGRQQAADARGGTADGESRPGQRQGLAGEQASSGQEQDTPSEQDKDSASDGPARKGNKQGGAGAEDGQQREDSSSEGAEQDGGSQGQQRDPRGQNSANQNQSGQNQAGSESEGQQSQGAGNRAQSLARSVMQALKNLLSRATGGQQAQSQQNGQRASDAARNQSQAGANAGNTPGNPANQSPQPGKGNEQGNESPVQAASGSQQAGQQKAGTGVGQQPGSENAGAAESPLPGGAHSPDRVGLQTHQFTGEAQVRARPGDGAVKTAARQVKAPTGARVQGAEQESVPQRYRHYLQRYFAQSPGERK